MRSSAQALVLLLTLGSCVDLSAVREFAKTSAATADYHQLVDDYIESPTRAARWASPSRAQELTKQAEARAGQRAQLEAAQAVVVSYLSALGDAAADDLSNINSEVDALAGALQQAGSLDANLVGGAASIAKVLGRLALDGWRQSQVKAIVMEVDPHLQNALAGLREIAAEDFVQAFQSEQADIEAAFGAWLAASKKLNDPTDLPQPLAVIGRERVQQLEDRKTAARQYAEVLAKIGEGHAKLACGGLALDDKQLVATLKGYAKDLQTIYRALRKLAN